MEDQMKKSLLAFAALSACAALAHAESGVTLYGTIDVGYAASNSGLNPDPNAATTYQYLPAGGNGGKYAGGTLGMAGSNLTPSKWGIRGVEEMDGGLKAMFTLESALNVNYGTNPNGRLNDSLPGSGSQVSNGEGSIQGQMFDRESTLGLEGSFGSLKAGRQTTVMADTIGAYDPLRVSYASSPLGFNGGYGGAGFTGEARWDNSLKYNKTFGNVGLALGYKTAGMTNGIQQGQGMGATIDYSGANWGVRFGLEANNDAIIALGGSAANVNGYSSLSLQMADTYAALLAGRYVYNSFTFKGGWEHIVTSNPSSGGGYDNTTNYPSLNGIPVSAINVSAFNQPRTQDMYWGGLNYQATPRIEVSGAVYQLNTSTYGSVGSLTYGSTSQALYYGAQATYTLSKRTKLYVTGMTSFLSGPAWNNSTNNVIVPQITTFSTGVAHSF